MDPTQTLIDALSALQALEDAFKRDPRSEATETARAEAIGNLRALADWLSALDGPPPAISEIALGDE